MTTMWKLGLSVAVLACACAYPNPVRSDGGTTRDGTAQTGDGHGSGSGSCAPGSMTFSYTGAPATLSLPACVTHINVDLSGAAGGSGYGDNPNYAGGLGARVQGSLTVPAGSTITVYVGGMGSNAAAATGGLAGYNGGGTGSFEFDPAGGGGGGASDIRIGGTDLQNRVFVAAGGGGAGVDNAGGDGGGLSASAAPGGSATGGTQTAGGSGGVGPQGNGNPGTLGSGGTGGDAGGGGGAGYYGGGGGGFDGGAGGSSFADANATNVVMLPGFQAQNGSVTISY